MKIAPSILCLAVSALLGVSIAPLGHVSVSNAESHPLGVMGEFQIHVGDTVHFEAGSTLLTSSALQTLHRQALFLLEYPSIEVMLTGSASETDGVSVAISRENAYKLGEQRAKEVRDYLVSQGVHPSRIFTESNGKEVAPYAENRTVFTQLIAGSAN